MKDGRISAETLQTVSRDLMPREDYIKMANQETMVITMCENKEGVDNLEEIVKVPGVDIIMIGAYDLSVSLGIPGQFDNPLELEALARAQKIALATGKVVGRGAANGDQAREFIAQNVLFITASVHEFITPGVKEYLTRARGQ